MSIVTLVEKRSAWLEVLNGDDVNSIANQLSVMAWNFAAFKIVIEGRRIAPPAREGGVRLNGLVHEFIDQGFLTIIAAGVRRLIDPAETKKEDRKVFSLVGLLNDIVKHSYLLTREAIFQAEGLVYDYAPLEIEERNRHGERVAAGGPAAAASSNIDNWRGSSYRHRTIDLLARVAAVDRNQSDRIPTGLIALLLNRVDDACKTIGTFATKYIAHAATPHSRAADQTVDPKYGELEKALSTLCEVAAFVATRVLGDSFASPVAHPTYDHLAYIDRPLVDAGQVDGLREVWEGFSRNASDWVNWTPAEIDLTVEERRSLAYKLAGTAVASVRYSLPARPLHLVRPATDDLGYPANDESSPILTPLEQRCGLVGRLAGFFADRSRGPATGSASLSKDEMEFAAYMVAVFARSDDELDPRHQEVTQLVVDNWFTIVRLAERLIVVNEMTAQEVVSQIEAVG